MKSAVKEQKLCPLNEQPCLRQSCALWIEIQKDAPNPSYIYEYRGCGLINHIPWQPHKREEPTEAPTNEHI